MADPIAFRLEFRPGRYSLYTPEGFASEMCREGCRQWALFAEPQPDCDPEPAAYYGRHFVQAKYAGPEHRLTMRPLYLGPLLHEPGIDPTVAMLFPSIVEERLKSARPDLFPGLATKDTP